MCNTDKFRLVLSVLPLFVCLFVCFFLYSAYASIRHDLASESAMIRFNDSNDSRERSTEHRNDVVKPPRPACSLRAAQDHCTDIETTYERVASTREHDKENKYKLRLRNASRGDLEYRHRSREYVKAETFLASQLAGADG